MSKNNQHRLGKAARRHQLEVRQQEQAQRILRIIFASLIVLGLLLIIAYSFMG